MSETNLTHFKKLDNPDYIGAYAFQPGEKKTVTIAQVTRETVTGADGKREECTLVHWREGEKPLILNATNGKMIHRVLGTPYIEQWAGQRVVLGVEKVKAFGDVVDAVRVQRTKPGPASAADPFPQGGSGAPGTLPQGGANRPDRPCCADCGAEIADGDGFTARQIVAAGMRRYGVAVCLACAKMRKGDAGLSARLKGDCDPPLTQADVPLAESPGWAEPGDTIADRVPLPWEEE